MYSLHRQTDRLFFALYVRNQHVNTDARLLPAPQDIVVVYWRQRHTRLGPPSPSPYGHSRHGLTHDTESYASMAHRIPGPHQLGQFGARRLVAKRTIASCRRSARIGVAVARRQLLDQQTMAQARLRQPTAALRTHIPTHRARALFAAALGASGDLHTRPVSMQGLKIEQCRGK